MKRSINLLPVERKNEIKLDCFNRFAFKMGSITVFAILLFVGFLFSNLFIIGIYSKINQDEMNSVDSGELNSVIQEAKTEIDNYYSETSQVVEEFSSRAPYWDYLNEINQLLPEEVYYSKINMEPGIIKLEGVAVNRSDLVEFKNSLEQVDYFKEVEMPISSFTSQENVKYEITLTLNKQ